MAQIANYQDWIKRTNYDWRHPRSGDLKKLDKKVEYYFVNWKGSNHDAAKADLLNEFERYCHKKWDENGMYRPSSVMGITLSLNHPRNKDDAFTDLRNTIHSNTFYLDRRMKAAQDAMMEGQNNLLERLFLSAGGGAMQFTLKEKIGTKDKFMAGCRAIAVTVKAPFNGGKTFNPTKPIGAPGGDKGKNVTIGDAAKVGYQGIKTGLRTDQAIKNISHVTTEHVVKNYGPEITKELTGVLGPHLAGQVGSAIGEAIPIVGHIWSAVSLVKCAVEVAQLHMLKEDLQHISNMGFAAPGSPQAALDAVIALYGRICTQKDIDMGFQVAKFGAQFDPTRISSTTLGATDAARKMITLIANLIIEFKEIHAANNIIKDQSYKQNFEQMFVSCPLLGAYVIIGSETSSLINVAVKYYGTNGWQVQVESMRTSIQQLYEASADLIKKSRYEIPNFPKLAMKRSAIPSTCVSQSVRATWVKERIVGQGPV